MTNAGPFAQSNRKQRRTSHRLLAELDLSPQSIAQKLARRMGIPLPDKLPGPYLPPTREGLMKSLTSISKGERIFYKHPQLSGMGFSEGQIETAVQFAIEAESALFEGIETISPKERSPHDIQLLLDMVANKEFERASKTADTKTQMRIALEALVFKTRIDEMAEQNPSAMRGDLERQAKEDIKDARMLVKEFLVLKKSPKTPKAVPVLIAKMNEMEWGSADGTAFEFDMALRAIGEQRKPKKPINKLFWDLMPHEKELVAGALKKTGEIGENDLALFINMRPGVRDLLIRNFIATRWTEGNWAKDFGKYEEARNSVYKICGLREPTREEKIDAVLQIRYLTPNQLHFISMVIGDVAGPLRDRHINDFRKRIAEDPQRLNYWRAETTDLLTLGDLAHKIIFSPQEKYTSEEMVLLSEIRRTLPDSLFHEELTEEGRDSIKKAFTYPLSQDNEYNDQFQTISRFADELKLESLLAAAQRQAEFYILLEFLDIPAEKASGQINYSNCNTRAKEGKGNDDSVSSAVVTLHDGTKVVLDAVFDGMGGHMGGSVASGIAKDIFEVAAIAGWITSPEDVRKVFVTTHLAIILEQIKHLKEKRESEGHSEDTDGYWKQCDNMGTTAVVSFQYGRKFYGIHCGDSDYKIIRNRRIVFQSDCHTLLNDFLKAREASKNKEEIPPKKAKEWANVVTSALGSIIGKIQINNKDSDYGHFMLQRDDKVVTVSDGITDTVCDHEYQIIIDKVGGNLQAAASELVDLAGERDDSKEHYVLLCDCGKKVGKNDDKSLILRRAGDAMYGVGGGA